MSLLGLGVVLVGALIALWWTTGVQVDLSVLRGPAAFLNYRHADRPTTRPGADPTDPSTTMAAMVQAAAVAPTPAISEPQGLLEGALVTVLERQEPEWVRVRGDGGHEGWLPAQYLLPAQ